MPPAAARAVTRGRFRVTQEDAAASPAPRDGADDQRVLRGLQHQSTMVLQRLAELEKAVRSQHRGGDEPPREAPKGAGANLEDLDASAATRPLRRAHDLATELRDALAAARTRAGEHESMLKLLKQKHASLAAKLEAGQADAARLRRENEALRRDRDRFKRELDDERARHQARARAPPPPAAPASRAPVPAPAVVARRAAADREFAAIAAQAARRPRRRRPSRRRRSLRRARRGRRSRRPWAAAIAAVRAARRHFQPPPGGGARPMGARARPRRPRTSSRRPWARRRRPRRPALPAAAHGPGAAVRAAAAFRRAAAAAHGPRAAARAARRGRAAARRRGRAARAAGRRAAPHAVVRLARAAAHPGHPGHAVPGAARGALPAAAARDGAAAARRRALRPARGGARARAAPRPPPRAARPDTGRARRRRAARRAPPRRRARASAAADVAGAFVVPEPAAPPAAEPFCPARHAAEEDEFGAIAGRTAIGRAPPGGTFNRRRRSVVPPARPGRPAPRRPAPAPGPQAGAGRFFFRAAMTLGSRKLIWSSRFRMKANEPSSSAFMAAGAANGTSAPPTRSPARSASATGTTCASQSSPACARQRPACARLSAKGPKCQSRSASKPASPAAAVSSAFAKDSEWYCSTGYVSRKRSARRRGTTTSRARSDAAPRHAAQREPWRPSRAPASRARPRRRPRAPPRGPAPRAAPRPCAPAPSA